MMTALLTSSPCVYQAPRAILNPENCFLAHLYRLLPEPVRCLFVCSAPESFYWTDKVAKEMEQAFSLAGLPFEELLILDRRTDRYAAELIARSNFLILSGGHVPTQNAYFREIGLRQLLQDYDGVILGISAGSMNAAEVVYAQPEESGESAPDFPRFLPGLGLTDVQILPHYQMVKDNVLDGLRLFEDITCADSMGQCFFALPDSSFFRIEQGITTLHGEAWCIENGTIRQISQPGDVIVF